MEYWYSQKPELRMAYDQKEDYLQICDEEFYTDGLRVRSKDAARYFYEEWLGNFPVDKKYPDLYRDFKKISSVMKNWASSSSTTSTSRSRTPSPNR